MSWGIGVSRILRSCSGLLRYDNGALGNGRYADEFSQFHMFYIFALFSVFIDNKSLYESFGFYKEHPIIIGFVLFSDALAPMDTVVKLLMNILSRKFEFEAGGFSLSSPFLMFSLSTFVPFKANFLFFFPGLPDAFAVNLGYKTQLA